MDACTIPHHPSGITHYTAPPLGPTVTWHLGPPIAVAVSDDELRRVKIEIATMRRQMARIRRERRRPPVTRWTSLPTAPRVPRSPQHARATRRPRRSSVSRVLACASRDSGDGDGPDLDGALPLVDARGRLRWLLPDGMVLAAVGGGSGGDLPDGISIEIDRYPLERGDDVEIAERLLKDLARAGTFVVSAEGGAFFKPHGDEAWIKLGENDLIRAVAQYAGTTVQCGVGALRLNAGRVRGVVRIARALAPVDARVTKEFFKQRAPGRAGAR